MQAAGVRRGPAVWCCRRLLEKSGIGWNRPSLRPVVEGVRKLRAAAAVLVASCVVVSGCTSSGEEEAATASEPVVEPPSNPWDLPLEQRPPLFDPCEEIPIEAVEEGVGAPMEPGDLRGVIEVEGVKTCDWMNKEIRLTVLSTWKSHKQYLADPELVLEDSQYSVTSRDGMLMKRSDETFSTTCHALFFTGAGTVLISLVLNTSLGEFQGTFLNDSCDVISRVLGPIVGKIPQGDFR